MGLTSIPGILCTPPSLPPSSRHSPGWALLLPLPAATPPPRPHRVLPAATPGSYPACISAFPQRPHSRHRHNSAWRFSCLSQASPLVSIHAILCPCCPLCGYPPPARRSHPASLIASNSPTFKSLKVVLSRPIRLSDSSSTYSIPLQSFLRSGSVLGP